MYNSEAPHRRPIESLFTRKDPWYFVKLAPENPVVLTGSEETMIEQIERNLSISTLRNRYAGILSNRV